MKKSKKQTAKVIVPLILIGIGMALLLILIPGKPEHSHDQNSSAPVNQFNIEAFSEEMGMRETIGDSMIEEESEKSDTRGMVIMLEELESAK